MRHKSVKKTSRVDSYLEVELLSGRTSAPAPARNLSFIHASETSLSPTTETTDTDLLLREMDLSL
jgi:hypothetical protein